MLCNQRLCFAFILTFFPSFAIVLLCTFQAPKTPVKKRRIDLNLVSDSGKVSGQQNVVDAIIRLKTTCDEWKHLDPGIVSRVDEQAKFGPEANVKVHVVDNAGKPVSGALVLIQESEFELGNYVEPRRAMGPLTDLPLALRATDSQGEVQFSKIRRTHPGMFSREMSTVAVAYIVVLHPDHAWSLTRLQSHADLQELEIKLEDGHERTGRIVDENGHGVAGVTFSVTGFSECEMDWVDQNRFRIWFSHFRMQSESDDQGYYRLMTLPRKGWISHSLGHADWQKSPKFLKQGLNNEPERQTNLEVEAEATVHVVEPKKRNPIQLRFLDANSHTPISGAGAASAGRRIAPVIAREDGTLEIDEIQSWTDPISKKEIIALNIFPIGSYYGFYLTTEKPLSEERLDIYLEQGIRIQGRVIDEATGMPLPEVWLQEMVADSEAGSNEKTGANKKTPFHCMKTDKEGRFSFFGPPAKLDLQIISGVYGCEVSILQPGSFGERSNAKPTGITIDATDAKEVAKEIVFSLKPVRSIRGMVIDEDELPIEGATVYATASMDDSHWRSTAKTDAKGEYEVLPPPGISGPFKLVVEYQDKAICQELQANDIGSYVGPPVDFTLTSANLLRTITGRVVLDGIGLQGASVRVYEYDQVNNAGTQTSTLVGAAKTDQDGMYEIRTPIPSKPVVYNAILSSPADLALSQSMYKFLTPEGNRFNVPDLDFRTRYGDLTVSGRVITPEGEPVEGVEIRARNNNVELVRANIFRNKEDRYCFFTDKDGRFVCEGLGEGEVHMQIQPSKARDAWTNAFQLAFETVGGKDDLVIVLDPTLAKPPLLVEPISSIPIANDHTEKGVREGTGTILSGQVFDSANRPLENVLIKVFAAKPTEGMPTCFPLAHPFCDLSTYTDAEGRYSLPIPVASCKIRLVAWRENFEGKLSNYIDCSQKKNWISNLVEIGASPKISRIVVDENQMPIAGVLVIGCSSGSRETEIDELGLEHKHSVSFTNDKGELGLIKHQRNYETLFYKKGRGAYVLNGIEFDKEPIKIKPSFAIEGRVVDDAGPLGNFPLVVTSTYGRICFRVMTDADGRFRFDEIDSDEVKNKEVFLSSDLSKRDLRGWLDTRRIAKGVKSECLQLSDLKVSPTRNLTVNLVDEEGKPLESDYTFGVSLRQDGNGAAIEGSGTSIFTGLPTEPIFINLGFKPPRKITSTQPILTQAGFDEWIRYATQLKEDSDVTFIVAPRKQP